MMPPGLGGTPHRPTRTSATCLWLAGGPCAGGEETALAPDPRLMGLMFPDGAWLAHALLPCVQGPGPGAGYRYKRGMTYL